MKTAKFNLKNNTTYRYLFKRDNFFATILVFIVILLFARIGAALAVLDPKELSTKDFNFSDMAYMFLNKPAEVLPSDVNVVIVNIGDSPRSVVANVISRLAACNPRAVGVDVDFSLTENDDTAADANLKAVAQKYPNVVMACSLDPSLGYIAKGILPFDSLKQGYTNFTLDNQHVVREFEPFVSLGGRKYTSFAAAVVKAARPGAYDTLARYHAGRQVIDYDYKEDNYDIKTVDEVLKDASLKSSIAGKIVLVGYISKDKFDSNDKHWTPLRSTIADKTLPDLNGIVIHADIIRMIIYQTYIHKAPWLLAWAIAFVICWVHMAFFIGYFIEKHTWFHLAAKIAQLLSAMVFIYLGLFLFFYFHWLIDMTSAIFAIVLAVDVLYFYEAGVMWFHKHKGFKTLFHHEEHH